MVCADVHGPNGIGGRRLQRYWRSLNCTGAQLLGSATTQRNGKIGRAVIGGPGTTAALAATVSSGNGGGSGGGSGDWRR